MSKPPGPRYALVTPARNEARTLGQTIAAVALQTLPPVEWVVVDDGSTDATAAIVREAAGRLPFLRLIDRRDRGHDLVGAGVVAALRDGFAALATDCDFIGKLDADIVPPPDHYARLLAVMAAHPRLGIASGREQVRNAAGELVTEKRLRFHPVGAARVWRRQVLVDNGGLVESLGWDTLDVVRARVNGWLTTNLDGLPVLHQRPLGGRGNLADGVRRRGRASYLLGYSRLYFAARVLFFTWAQTPRPWQAWWLFQGYWRALRAGEPRIVNAAERRWLRRFQHRLLLGLGDPTPAFSEPAGEAG